MGTLAENLVHKGFASGSFHVLVADSDKELADFRLENHNQGQHTHVQHHVQHGKHEPHVEGRNNDPYDEERYDGQEYAHG